MNVKDWKAFLILGGAALIAIGCTKPTAPLTKQKHVAAIECRTGYFIRGGVNGAPPDTVCNGDQ